MALLVCVKCNSDLDEVQPTSAPYFELIHFGEDSCGAITCVECYANFHAERGCTPFLQCPGCSRGISGHCFWGKQVRKTKTKTHVSRYHEQCPIKSFKPPSPDMDPYQYFLSRRSNEFTKDDLVLSIHWYDATSGKNRSMAIKIPTNQPSESYDNTTKEKLIFYDDVV